MALAGCATPQPDYRGAPISQVESARAEAVARLWLQYIDSGKYGEAFDLYSEKFKKRAGTKEETIEFYTDRRAPLGVLIKRDLVRKRYSHAYSAMPDGNYMELGFISKFQKKNWALEYIALEKKDSQWRILGYRFK